MTKIQEKRKLPRYLCDQNFSDTRLTINSIEREMVSVNFNRYGIALYSHKRLPPQEKCVLSICYQRQQTIQISALTAMIRHRFETETGHQYGIEFVYHPEKDTQLSDQLLAIEAELSKDYDPENRYNFIDGH